MVYSRDRAPETKHVVREATESELRVVPDHHRDEVSLEHATGKSVHQGIRFKVDEIDDLIEALEAAQADLEADDAE